MTMPHPRSRPSRKFGWSSPAATASKGLQAAVRAFRLGGEGLGFSTHPNSPKYVLFIDFRALKQGMCNREPKKR